MQKIRIFSDGAADIPPELCRKYDIETVPFYISWDGRVREDFGITPGEVFEYVAGTGVQPGTVACTADDYRGRFQVLQANGFGGAVCVTVSAKFSASYANAVAAAETMTDVVVVDSESLSGGEGVLALACAQMASEGMAVTEIEKEAKKLKPKIHASMLLDTVAYLRKGGECLGLNPEDDRRSGTRTEILVEDGKLRVGRLYEGSLQETMEKYIDMQLAVHPPARADRILVVHTGCPVNILDAVKGCLVKHTGMDPVGFVQARGTLVCHSGPNALGLFYI